jgi:sugar phosphate permease
VTPSTFARQRLNVVAIAWVTYASYYLGRVNISTAIPELRSDLGFTAQTAGALATGFFLTYAVGQFVSGYLGDRLSPRWLVFFGLLLSSVLNFTFGFLAQPETMLLIWSVIRPPAKVG